MPNLPTHLKFALEVSKQLDSPIINAHLGSFLLGATSPDIRVITKVDRSVYHFVQLDFKDVGDGIDNMFKSYPTLSNFSQMDSQLQAFISGYITHLIADECWISEVFRKYFASSTVFPDINEGLILDRAMQLNLDRAFWKLDYDFVGTIQSEDYKNLNLEFIESDLIEEWSNWVCGFIGRGFSWDRLRFMARRISRGDDTNSVHRTAEIFLKDIPLGLSQLFDLVPRSVFQNYENNAVELMLLKIRNYSV